MIVQVIFSEVQMHTLFLIKLLIHLADKEHDIHDDLDSNGYESGNESTLVHPPKISIVDKKTECWGSGYLL